MGYPFWDTSIGYGLLMATIAVFHVFISHFAIGGGLYLVITEYFARKSQDQARLDYLERLSKFFILLTLVVGALSGVAIWFIIGLINPAATELLIKTFVWAWATEWSFFILEIGAALIYYYGWKRLSARDHLFVGWVYFGAAWMSLFVINGIVTFMLTPGEWLVTREFWDGFFNPTFWPSLVIRTGICVMLAGLFAALVTRGVQDSKLRLKLTRYNSIWGLVGVAIVAPSFAWYFGSLPADIAERLQTMMPSVTSNIDQSYWYLAGVGVILIIFGIIFPRMQRTVVSVLALSLALGWFARFEMVREGARKPFVIPGYMYGNGVEVAQSDTYASEGYLSAITYRTGDDGADLFRHACRSCHTLSGYRALKPALDGTDAEFIAGCIRGATSIVGAMPPFLGTEEEIETLADYIHQKTDRRSLGAIYGLKGVELGEKVFEVRCGKCHVFGGINDNYESLIDLSADEYEEMLNELDDLADEMPAFSGDETERQALIQFFQSLTLQENQTTL